MLLPFLWRRTVNVIFEVDVCTIKQAVPPIQHHQSTGLLADSIGFYTDHLHCMAHDDSCGWAMYACRTTCTQSLYTFFWLTQDLQQHGRHRSGLQHWGPSPRYYSSPHLHHARHITMHNCSKYMLFFSIFGLVHAWKKATWGITAALPFYPLRLLQTGIGGLVQAMPCEPITAM